MLQPPPCPPLFPYTTLFRSVLLDRERWIDDRGLMTLAGGSQVGGAATSFVEELLEVHRRVPRGLSVEDGKTARRRDGRSEEHTSELQSPCNLVCRLLLEKKK